MLDWISPYPCGSIGSSSSYGHPPLTRIPTATMKTPLSSFGIWIPSSFVSSILLSVFCILFLSLSDIYVYYGSVAISSWVSDSSVIILICCNYYAQDTFFFFFFSSFCFRVLFNTTSRLQSILNDFYGFLCSYGSYGCYYGFCCSYGCYFFSSIFAGGFLGLLDCLGFVCLIYLAYSHSTRFVSLALRLSFFSCYRTYFII